MDTSHVARVDLRECVVSSLVVHVGSVTNTCIFLCVRWYNGSHVYLYDIYVNRE